MILLQLYTTFFKIGFFGFGGGYAMISLLEKEIIRNRGWLTAAEFIDIFAIAEMTPGIIAINSATFVGFRVAGFCGSLLATLVVVTPSLLVLLVIIYFLKQLNKHPMTRAFFRGLRPAVLALISLAAIFVTRTAVIDIQGLLVALAVFALMLFTRIHPIVTILIAAAVGLAFF